MRARIYTHTTLARACAWLRQDVKPKEQAGKEQKGEKEEKPKPGIWEALVNNVLKNPFIWGMALTYFFIYVVRQVCPLALPPQGRCVPLHCQVCPLALPPQGSKAESCMVDLGALFLH